MGQGNFQVWIGNGRSYSGCGVVVDSRHIVSCNHVVRQSLQELRLGSPNASLYGGDKDDLVGEKVLARVEGYGRDIELQVVGNHPLPYDDPGERPFDDLCLLKVAAPDIDLKDRATLIIGEPSSGTAFSGQGIAATAEPPHRYVSQLFVGKIELRALFTHWNFTSEPEKHLTSKPRFSGAALQMPGTSRIFGLLQGSLIEQVGYFVPAQNIADYLKSSGISPACFDPSESVFKSIFRPSKFNLTKDKLVICDRDDQVRHFDAAKKKFLDHLFETAGGQLFAIGIAGKKHDMPDLLQLRLGPDAVHSYRDFRRRKLQDQYELNGPAKFPTLKITMEFDAPDMANLGDFVINKIGAAGNANGMFHIGLFDKGAIVDELEQFDSPFLFIVYCPERLFSEQMVAAWAECLTEIAAMRSRQHPIIAILIVKLDSETADFPTFDTDGFSMLPMLNELDESHVKPWVGAVTPGDDDAHEAIFAHIQKMSEGRRFRMRDLQDWLFADENQQGTGI